MTPQYIQNIKMNFNSEIKNVFIIEDEAASHCMYEYNLNVF